VNLCVLFLEDTKTEHTKYIQCNEHEHRKSKQFFLTWTGFHFACTCNLRNKFQVSTLLHNIQQARAYQLLVGELCNIMWMNMKSEWWWCSHYHAAWEIPKHMLCFDIRISASRGICTQYPNRFYLNFAQGKDVDKDEPQDSIRKILCVKCIQQKRC